MIQFKKHSEIDKTAWDACIHRSDNANFCALSWFLDVVSPHWCALVQNDYEAVFPLSYSKKVGITYSLQPLFAQQLGVFSQKRITPVWVDEFLEAIPHEFRYLDLNLNFACQPEKAAVLMQNNYVLRLGKPYKELQKGYSQNLKRNLKKAQNRSFELRNEVPLKDVISLFRENRGKTISNLSDEAYRLFYKVASKCRKQGICRTRGIFDENQKLLAAAVWIIYKNAATFWFSALSQAGKESAAMPFLIDRFIEENAEKLHVLDFEGSNNTNLARFYQSFGSELLPYFRYQNNRLPFGIRELAKWKINLAKKVITFFTNDQTHCRILRIEFREQ